MSGNIRILRTGLTVGLHMYQEGDLVDPLSQTHDLVSFADGKLHDGHRWAEWVEAPQHKSMTDDVTLARESVSDAKPEAAEAPAPSVPADLAKAIKDLVAAGQGKTAIVKQLATGPDISQRQVQAVFDELLATGQVVATGELGVYRVQD